MMHVQVTQSSLELSKNRSNGGSELRPYPKKMIQNCQSVRGRFLSTNLELFIQNIAIEVHRRHRIQSAPNNSYE